MDDAYAGAFIASRHPGRQESQSRPGGGGDAARQPPRTQRQEMGGAHGTNISSLTVRHRSQTGRGRPQGGRRRAHLASFRRAVSRKSLISLICFGCQSGSAGAPRVVRRAAHADRRHSGAWRTRGGGRELQAGRRAVLTMLAAARGTCKPVVLAWGPTVLGGVPRSDTYLQGEGARDTQVFFPFSCAVFGGNRLSAVK